jgi:hypothetical protein
VWQRHLKIVTDTQPQSTIETISGLLTRRSVEHTVKGASISSTYIPFPFFSWDRRLYSHDNFMGVNPFIFIDSLNIEVKAEKESKTEVDITESKCELISHLSLSSCLLFRS